MSERCAVLGIHDGHNCGASLLVDGVIVASISEERLTRTKNEVGYPKGAVEAVLALGGVSAGELARVAIASDFMHDRAHLEEIAPWYRVGIDDQRKDKKAGKDYNRVVFEMRRKQRIADVTAHLGIDSAKVVFVNHHFAHATAAYYASRAPRSEPTLVMTNDGAGDGLSASVSIAQNNNFDRKLDCDRSTSLGKIFSRVTYLMGMKPWEHEYKLMGMAPYADEKYSNASKAVFEQLLGLSEDGTNFCLKTELETNYCYFWLRDHLENHRFDAIAAGVQAFTEEMLSNWVSAWVKKTGIRNVVLGGGCFMNVKANSRIAAIPGVDYVFAMPSCGDESLSLGAAYQVYVEQCGGKDGAPLDTLYLGLEYGDEDVKAAIASTGVADSCEVIDCEDIDARVGEELADNRIVARVRGRMEWGARALGARSILANASDYRNVERINAMIKQRDFWMPFAPSILKERAADYIVSDAEVDASFMMYAFPTTKLADEHLAAGIHPRDKTARAQTVDAKVNPRYHKVIKTYEEKTGRGGILNTSFNLHGFPIVCTPAEAIDVFVRSGLESLALENCLLRKTTS